MTSRESINPGGPSTTTTAHTRRERRSVSPSRGSVDGKTRSHRSGTTAADREKRRTRRPRSSSSNVQQEMGWARASKSPARATGRDVASRQLKQQLPGAGDATSNDSKDRRSSNNKLVLKRDSSFRSRSSATSVSGLASLSENSVNKPKKSPKTKRESFTTSNAGKKVSSATASSRDIDDIISQFREHCDIHMATLLELKNNITTTEKAVVTSTEKDKEFLQVRKWYSALVEKHTKLQKEHQKLQEEHLALQEKYMNLKQASKLDDSMANMSRSSNRKDKEKKKKNKDGAKKGLGEIVWQRAGNM